jgi:hypothetical protein
MAHPLFALTAITIFDSKLKERWKVYLNQRIARKRNP